MTVVEYVVAKGKTEIGRCTVVIDGDSLVSSKPGAAGDANAVDVVFTLTPALAESIATGSLTVGVGFMRGAVKMAGDFGALLTVLPVLHHTSGFALSAGSAD